MLDNFLILSSRIWQVLGDEKPLSILEVSMFDNKFGRLFNDYQSKFHNKEGARVDRICVDSERDISTLTVYNNVFSVEKLDEPDSLEVYDFIFVAHVFENLDVASSFEILGSLLKKINKQLYLVTPTYIDDVDGSKCMPVNIAYYPDMFCGMDFKFNIYEQFDGGIQFYQFFPYVNFAPLSCDIAPKELQTFKKLHIACILPVYTMAYVKEHFLRHISLLFEKGHSISLYLKTPQYSNDIHSENIVSTDPFFKKISIPETTNFESVIHDVDMILVCDSEQLSDFTNLNLPLVLWNCADYRFYGLSGANVYSDSDARAEFHKLYRKNVNLIGYAPYTISCLKSLFNREAWLLNPGIDCNFFRPSKKNENTVAILFETTDNLTFKDYDFIATSLSMLESKEKRIEFWLLDEVDLSDDQCGIFSKRVKNPSEEDRLDLIRSAQIYLSCNLSDPYPYRVLQAMACETAVVCLDTIALEEFIRPGVNALIFPPGDIGSLAAALTHLIENPEQITFLAQFARETARQFSFEVVNEKLEKMLLDIFEERRSLNG